MRQARYGGTPIPMPDIPSGIGGLGRFAVQVRNALRALRDRPVLTRPNSAPYPIHPWKVTANGDDTVHVHKGSVIYCATAASSGSEPNEPFTFGSITYAGGDVTVTGTGIVSVVIDCDILEVSNSSLSGVRYYVYVPATDDPVDLLVDYDQTPTGTQLSFPLAGVSLTDGVASVTSQALDHNLVLQMGHTLVL